MLRGVHYQPRAVGRVVSPASGLCVGRARKGAVLGLGPRTSIGKSLCARWPAIPCSRADNIWTGAEKAVFLERAHSLAFASFAGALDRQRQGDLLRLPWSAYDGKHIRER